MQPQNYTPIDDLVQKHIQALTSKPPESEPLSASEPLKLQDVAEQKERKEAEPSQEIEMRKEHVELPPELKNVGIENDQVVDLAANNDVALPLPDDKIILGLHAPISSSLRWLAMFAMYLLRHAHMTLKVVHGKAKRVRIM